MREWHIVKFVRRGYLGNYQCETLVNIQTADKHKVTRGSHRFMSSLAYASVRGGVLAWELLVWLAAEIDEAEVDGRWWRPPAEGGALPPTV
jgi:hypothetical protein